MSVLFYRQSAQEAPEPGHARPESVVVHFWKPSPLSLFPPKLPLQATELQAAVQYLIFHALGILRNKKYSVCGLYDEQHLAHISFIYPGYFRFPFMAENELQIGATWTDLRYRGQGLATLAIKEIVSRMKDDTPTFWYLCDKANVASIRAVEKAGFRKVGEGRLRKRFGLGLLGVYEITKWENAVVSGS